MKRVLLILMIIVITFLSTFSTSAKNVSVKSFLNEYKKGNFSKADSIAKKLPKKAKSINNKMTSKMKRTYKKKIMNTKDLVLYCLADITGDKKPELVLQVGTCDADYKLIFYKLSGSKLKRLGKVDGGNSMLYDYPGKKALVLARVHSDSETIKVVKLVKGKIKSNVINCRVVGREYTTIPYFIKYYYYNEFNKNLSPFN